MSPFALPSFALLSTLLTARPLDTYPCLKVKTLHPPFVRHNRRMRLLMGAAVLLSSVCGYLSYQVIRYSMLKQVEQRALLTVQKGVDDIDLWLSTRQSAIESIANAPSSRLADWRTVGPYLTEETARLNDFALLGLSNAQGMRYTTADNRLVNASDRSWFQQAMAGKPHIDDPFISRATGEPIIAISAPIPAANSLPMPSVDKAVKVADTLSNATPIGVIHGGVGINLVAQCIDQVQYGALSYAFLLNAEGRAIVHPDKTLMSTAEKLAPSLLHSADPALAAIAKNMVSRQQGIDRIRLNGQLKYIAYLPLKSVDWSVALVIPLSEVNRPIRLLDLMASIIVGLTGLMLAALYRLHTFEHRRQIERSRAAALIDERSRLAREIHDTLAHAFTGISLQLEAARGITQKLIRAAAAPPAIAESTAAAPSSSADYLQQIEDAQTYILRARDLARKGLSEARCSVRALRCEALETDSIPDALRKALSQTTRDTGLATYFHLEGEPIPLPEDVQLNLLRIVQEAVTNSLRHARASRLDVTLSFVRSTAPRQVQLRIVDNGIGFDPENLSPQAGFGLLGMRERVTRCNGTFELWSSAGIGTTIEVTMPLKGEQN